jgi:hypothetical protein
VISPLRRPLGSRRRDFDNEKISASTNHLDRNAPDIVCDQSPTQDIDRLVNRTRRDHNGRPNAIKERIDREIYTRLFQECLQQRSHTRVQANGRGTAAQFSGPSVKRPRSYLANLRKIIHFFV